MPPVSLINFYLPAPGELILARLDKKSAWYPATYIAMEGVGRYEVSWINGRNSPSVLEQANVKHWNIVYYERQKGVQGENAKPAHLDFIVDSTTYDNHWLSEARQGLTTYTRKSVKENKVFQTIYNFMEAWLNECNFFATRQQINHGIENLLNDYIMEVSELRAMEGYEIILNPISLCDIIRKTIRSKYKSIQAFCQDVELMFSNALQYHTAIVETVIDPSLQPKEIEALEAKREISLGLLASTTTAKAKFQNLWARHAPNTSPVVASPSFEAVAESMDEDVSSEEQSSTPTSVQVVPQQVTPVDEMQGLIQATERAEVTSAPPEAPRRRGIKIDKNKVLLLSDMWWSPDLLPY